MRVARLSRASQGEDAEVLAVVDEYRAKLDLPTFKKMRSAGGEPEPADILTMQKDETVAALATLAEPCPGVPETLSVSAGVQGDASNGGTLRKLSSVNCLTLSTKSDGPHDVGTFLPRLRSRFHLPIVRRWTGKSGYNLFAVSSV